MISPYFAFQIFHMDASLFHIFIPPMSSHVLQEVLEELGLCQGRRPRGGGAAVHARHRGQAPRLRAGPPGRRGPPGPRWPRWATEPEQGAVTRNREAIRQKRAVDIVEPWANPTI